MLPNDVLWSQRDEGRQMMGQVYQRIESLVLESQQQYSFLQIYFVVIKTMKGTYIVASTYVLSHKWIAKSRSFLHEKHVHSGF